MVLENIYIQKTQPTFIIIGLGVSGLTCARHCIRNNYNIIILEKNKNLGGVWYNKTYPDVKLQTTKESYAFSDFSFYNNISLYPSGNEVLDYLEDKKTKIVLYTYDAFLFDYSNEDKGLIQEIVNILDYPVNIKQGKTYHGLEKL